MTFNPLDIDPKNLGYDFSKEWLTFTESRPCLFMALWLKRALENVRRCLEGANGPDVQKYQGMIQQIRQCLVLLESKNIEPQLKEVLAFLESYGK